MSSPTNDNNIVAMRGILFDTLRALGDAENPMDIERAKAISDVSQTIINSAKAEIEIAKVTGLQPSSSFIPTIKILPSHKSALPNKPEPLLPGGTTHPKPGVTVHKIR